MAVDGAFVARNVDTAATDGAAGKEMEQKHGTHFFDKAMYKGLGGGG